MFRHIILLFPSFHFAENKNKELSSEHKANLSPKKETYITRKHLRDQNIMKSRKTIYRVPYQVVGS